MGTRLAGKTALVTGATSNIGRAIAAAFAAEGAHVVVSGRNEERGGAVVEGIRSNGGRADFVRADLDGSAAVSRELAEEAERVLGGRVDVLDNNAAAVFAESTTDTDEATLDRVWAVNVKAPFLLTAFLAPRMAGRGGGAIVNISSWLARLGADAATAYNATKGALETLTRDWAAEFGPSGVRVNAISPGVIRDLESGEGSPEGAEAAMRGTPAGRSGPPEAIAHAAVHLASEEAAFVHGAVLDVDGGRTNIAVFGGG